MTDAAGGARMAVVTGATSDIGRAIAAALAATGRTVVIGYRANAEGAERLAAELGVLAPAQAVPVPIDVTDPSSLAGLTARVAELATETRGRLDVLVNCAGITEPVAHADLDGLTDEVFDRIMAVNVRGVFATIRALTPALRAGGGTIVNISSVAAVTGQGSNVAYCASKAALDSLGRSLGRALAPDVRVVSVSPGWVFGERAERMPSEVIAAQAAATPLARLATPTDVGAAVVAVVDHLPFTTGVALPVDGGRPLGVT
ncbi:MAG: SDR family oxidoreductase [Actinomycetota bacterium]